MTEYERVREQIATSLYEQHHPRIYDTFGELEKDFHNSAEVIRGQADAILSIEGICIKADNQSLPELPEFYEDWGGECGQTGYVRSRYDMLEAGFIKVVSNAK